MKKVLLAFIVSILVCSANAQITKGSIFLGGDIGGSTQKTKSGDETTNKRSSISISPVFGKAIKENLVLGVNAGFNIYNDENSSNNGEYDVKSYSAGLFLRRYKNLGASGFYIFVQGGMAATHFEEKRKSPYTTFEEIKRLTIGINAYPGISYAVSKKLHLETGFNNLLSVYYFHEKRDVINPVAAYKTNGLGFSSSLNNASSLYVGFRLLIGK